MPTYNQRQQARYTPFDSPTRYRLRIKVSGVACLYCVFNVGVIMELFLASCSESL